jgi:hypothetical protein
MMDQFLNETGATFPKPNPAFRAGASDPGGDDPRSAKKKKKKAD